MGLYATIKSPVPCERCHQGTVDNAQIKLGDCSQLPQYQVGDRIRFATVRRIDFAAPADIIDAVAVGYPDPCDYCGGFQLLTVTLRSQRIVDVKFRSLASYELDNLLIGPERKGVGPFVHGARIQVEPTDLEPMHGRLKAFHWPGNALPTILGWLILGWLHRAIKLTAERDADGRLAVDWSLGSAPLPVEFPQALADRMCSGRLPSTELKRWGFICSRQAAPPPASFALGTPADSPHIRVYESAITAAQCSYW